MIFYFTGTGNSLYAATQLDEILFSIPHVMHSQQREFSDERIGIVCPVYGHEMPEMVKAFILCSIFNTEYLYVVLTYGKRHGNAVELAQKAFTDQERKPDYITTLLMVDNFLPVFDMEEEMKLDKKIPLQLASIKESVAKKRHFIQEVTQEDRNVHDGYLELVIHAPQTIWADFQVTDDCIGCGICTKVCPAECIRLENQKAVYKAENCQACYACIHACSKAAIKVNKILGFQEKNPRARYRNEHIKLAELIAANNQIENERKKEL